jgi:hypothetical protein
MLGRGSARQPAAQKPQSVSTGAGVRRRRSASAAAAAAAGGPSHPRACPTCPGAFIEIDGVAGCGRLHNARRVSVPEAALVPSNCTGARRRVRGELAPRHLRVCESQI